MRSWRMDDMSSSTVDMVFSSTALGPEREVCTIVNTSLSGGPLNTECLNSSPDFAGDVSLCTTVILLPLPPPEVGLVRKTAMGMDAMKGLTEAQVLQSPPAGPSSWGRVWVAFGRVVNGVVASIFVGIYTANREIKDGGCYMCALHYLSFYSTILFLIFLSSLLGFLPNSAFLCGMGP